MAEQLTKAERLDAICEEFGATYERHEDEGKVRMTLIFLGLEGTGFVEGDRLNGLGATTEAALAHLERRLGKGE
jgi:hypothetical protein